MSAINSLLHVDAAVRRAGPLEARTASPSCSVVCEATSVGAL